MCVYQQFIRNGYDEDKCKRLYILQAIENNVHRKTLKAASYTPVGALREVGISLMKSTLFKGKLTYYRGISWDQPNWSRQLNFWRP